MSISAVTLYNNGYASIERRAMVSGDTSVDVFFRAEDMPQVLSSFRVWSDQDGHVGNISYEASQQEPEMSLGNSALVDVLRHLRGSDISLAVAGQEGPLNGMVIGVEDLQVSVDNRIQLVKHVTVLDAEHVIRTIPLTTITSYRLVDQSNVSDLHHALSTHRSRQRDNMQRLTVFYKAADSKEHVLYMSYCLMLQPWKSTYRMTLGNTVRENIRKAHLAGFAVIENRQDEDWHDVKLTVATGAPAIVTASTGADSSASSGSMSLLVKGTDTQRNVRCNPSDNVYRLKEKVAGAFSLSVASIRLIFAGKQLEDGRTMADYNISTGSTIHMVQRSSADSNSLSSTEAQYSLPAQDCLSRFPVELPVTVLRRQTAMVPVVDETIEVQSIEVFDVDLRSLLSCTLTIRGRKGNPVLALLFDNDTGRALEGGSLQLIENGEYVGESTLTTVPAGDDHILTYAVDLGCEVSIRDNTSRFPPHSIRINEGTIQTTRYRRVRSMYQIVNRAEKSFILYLNHLFRDGWRLIEEHEIPDVVQQQPVDINDRHYVFHFPVQCKERTTFSVREETVDMKTYYISSMSHRKVDKFVKLGLLDKATEVELREIFALRKRETEVSLEVMELEDKLRKISADQREVRNNLDTLFKGQKETRKYTQKLSALEDEREKVQKEIATLKESRHNVNEELDHRIRELTYSNTIQKRNHSAEKLVSSDAT